MSKQRVFAALVLALALGITVAETRAQVGEEGPPIFTAAPFADKFCMTGSGGGRGVQYFPNFPPFWPLFGAKSDVPGYGFGGGIDATDVADMDNDGDSDFLVCDGLPPWDSSGAVILYTNTGGGVFTPSVVASGITTPVEGKSGGYCTDLRIADFDNNGLKDLVVGEDNYPDQRTRVYLQGPVGTFTPSALLDTSWAYFPPPAQFPGQLGQLRAVAAGDMNGDGNADILMLGFAGPPAGEVRFYAGDGAGGFALPALLFDTASEFIFATTRGLAIFDFEGDGDLDIIASSESPGEHLIYTNDGLGNFTARTGSVFDLFSRGIDAFDADGDGDHDLVVTAQGNQVYSFLYFVENLGGGLLAAPRIVDSEIEYFTHAVGCPPLEDANPPAEPTPVSVSPPSGAGSKQAFEFRFSTPNGSPVTGASVLIGEGFIKRNSCWIHYDPATNLIFLADDDLSPWFCARFGCTGNIRNSQCQVLLGGSKVKSIGTNVLILNFSLWFLDSGPKQIYLRSTGTGYDSGYIQAGTWNVP